MHPGPATASLPPLLHVLCLCIAYVILIGGPICVIALIIRVFRWLATPLGERLNKRDAATVRELAAHLQQMDQRVWALKRILDNEVPAWRGQYNTDDFRRQAS